MTVIKELLGALWSKMNRVPKISMSRLRKDDIPVTPGIYALYRGDHPIYVGRAKCLQQRLWKNHSGRGVKMTGSALRRNISEHLGFSTADDIKKGRYVLKSQELVKVRSWLDDCAVAWIECETEDAAILLEGDFKREYMPLLTKK